MRADLARAPAGLPAPRCVGTGAGYVLPGPPRTPSPAHAQAFGLHRLPPAPCLTVPGLRWLARASRHPTGVPYWGAVPWAQHRAAAPQCWGCVPGTAPCASALGMAPCLRSPGYGASRAWSQRGMGDTRTRTAPGSVPQH